MFEQAIGTGIGICIGGVVVLIITGVVLKMAARASHRKDIQELGDAWLRAVVTKAPGEEN